MPNPHASNDLVAALIGSSLFPPLYVRAIDGMLEPRVAVGAPKDVEKGNLKGLRVDLAAGIRPSDVVASISNARAGAARLALREVPVPRVDGAHGVLFPGLADQDALMRRLATPLAGIARVEPRRLLPIGPWDLAIETKDSISNLKVTRRPYAAAVGLSATTAHATRIGRFELEGAVDLSRSLRAFERYESDIAWLTDGLFAPRPGARSIDLGALAFLALRAGKDAPELQRPGMVLQIVDAIASDRMLHLGLLRRGQLVAPESARGDASNLAPNVPILVRSSMPIAVAAAEILAHDLGGIARALDDATFDKAMADGQFPLALDVVRPIDDSPDGAAIALATFDGATAPPGANLGARGVAAAGSAAFGWEVALIGAQASHVWIPRAPLGGFDLDVGAS